MPTKTENSNTVVQRIGLDFFLSEASVLQLSGLEFNFIPSNKIWINSAPWGTSTYFVLTKWRFDYIF